MRDIYRDIGVGHQYRVILGISLYIVVLMTISISINTVDIVLMTISISINTVDIVLMTISISINTVDIVLMTISMVSIYRWCCISTRIGNISW